MTKFCNFQSDDKICHCPAVIDGISCHRRIDDDNCPEGKTSYEDDS